MTRDLRPLRIGVHCSVVIALRHRDDVHNGPANARWAAAAGAHYIVTTIVRPFRRRQCRSATPSRSGTNRPRRRPASSPAASSPHLSPRGSLVSETARPSPVSSVAERARFLPNLPPSFATLSLAPSLSVRRAFLFLSRIFVFYHAHALPIIICSHTRLGRQ